MAIEGKIIVEHKGTDLLGRISTGIMGGKPERMMPKPPREIEKISEIIKTEKETSKILESKKEISKTLQKEIQVPKIIEKERPEPKILEIETPKVELPKMPEIKIPKFEMPKILGKEMPEEKPKKEEIGGLISNVFGSDVAKLLIPLTLIAGDIGLLVKSSGMLQGVLKGIGKLLMLIIKPLGDILGMALIPLLYIMKPIGTFFNILMKPYIQKAMAAMKAGGALLKAEKPKEALGAFAIGAEYLLKPFLDVTIKGLTFFTAKMMDLTDVLTGGTFHQGLMLIKKGISDAGQWFINTSTNILDTQLGELLATAETETGKSMSNIVQKLSEMSNVTETNSNVLLTSYTNTLEQLSKITENEGETLKTKATTLINIIPDSVEEMLPALNTEMFKLTTSIQAPFTGLIPWISTWGTLFIAKIQDIYTKAIEQKSVQPIIEPIKPFIEIPAKLTGESLKISGGFFNILEKIPLIGSVFTGLGDKMQSMGDAISNVFNTKINSAMTNTETTIEQTMSKVENNTYNSMLNIENITKNAMTNTEISTKNAMTNMSNTFKIAETTIPNQTNIIFSGVENKIAQKAPYIIQQAENISVGIEQPLSRVKNWINTTWAPQMESSVQDSLNRIMETWNRTMYSYSQNYGDMLRSYRGR